MKSMNLVPAMLLAMTVFTTPAIAEKPISIGSYIKLQNSNEWLVSNLIGENVLNSKKEVIGDINDLVLDGKFKTGAVVIGVGGFLGIGEKDVAVPLSALSISKKKDRVIITANITKASLEAAPDYKTLDEKKGGVKTKIQKQLSEAGEKMKDAAEKTSKKAKEAYNDAKESVKETIE